ncbi:ABC transporter substrate-binding protein [Pantanalinema rosaneae CENA516]|uniref:ABC transporter substrate-binding protein n=1 Tax=Pantanalinema rosaneae TaxID=1620701 RepID=UPI003D6EE3A6
MAKFRLPYFLIALLLPLLIWGCHHWRPSPPVAADQVITLKLSGWGASPTEQRLLQQVLQDFEASYPTIKVKFEVIADQYMDVIKTRLIGDAAPDVFYLDALEAPFLMAQNVLEPLDRYITPEFDLNDIEENLLQPFQYQNQTYGLPKDYSTLALFYNRQAFQAAGLTAPPTTWADLLTAAQQLTIDRNQDGKPEQYGLGITPELPRLMYSIRSFGGQAVDDNGYATFASDAALQGPQQILEQYQRDRTSARPLDVGTNNGSEMFGQEKAAMVLEGNWAIPFLKDTFPSLDFATAAVPQMNNQPGTMVYTVAYVMNRQSLHKQAAWTLIAYLTGKVGMEKWTSTGFALPSRRSVAAKLQVDRDPLRMPLVAGVQYATPWQVGRYPATIMNSFNNQYLSALLGQQALKPAMLQAQTSANQQIRAAE